MPLRIGLIGCGIISGHHLRAYHALSERARVMVTCDQEATRAEAAAATAGAARAVTDYRRVLDDAEVDAVDLCLPHHLHRPVTEAALAAGKHVLCQKPIATTLADADAMIEAAERTGRTLMIAEMMRFSPAVAKAQELLADGLIGRPMLVQSVTAWYQGGDYLHTPWRFDVAQMGGGALIDGGIHYVDLLHALLGPARRVVCLTSRTRDLFPAEDTALLMAEFGEGLLVSLAVLWSARHTPHLLFRISGTEGTLTADRGHIQVASDRFDGDTRTYDLPGGDGFARMIAHFVDCVADGTPPAMGGREARADLAFVLAAYESAASGRVVSLDEF